MFSHDVSYSKEASARPIAVRKIFNLLFLLPAPWPGRLVRQIGAAVQGGSSTMLRGRFERHRLRHLSDRQLIDAGIDLSRAGRGRAAAADPIAITILESLR